ncbi:MAG: hypothetical protein A3F17_01095 [Gammaproteobacteria bacterium RIFCSPHIGHO2_12_FULL_41_15]|nr:MAG: hypothetical protein A3F17_01095 [Gammaproteobacteria bacterium RIFCSPHIGHO2_12_FULL_41_15]
MQQAFQMAFLSQQMPYFIEEIDVSKHMLVVRCRGTRSVMKMSYVDIINQVEIIEGLSPVHACWIGGYLGRCLVNAEKKEILQNRMNISFGLKNKKGRYKILFQNRNGDIGYFDQKTKREFLESPLVVANNDHLITGFDPSQACYIGMLAGLSLEKTLSQPSKGLHQAQILLKKPPKLRIVT